MSRKGNMALKLDDEALFLIDRLEEKIGFKVSLSSFAQDAIKEKLQRKIKELGDD